MGVERDDERRQLLRDALAALEVFAATGTFETAVDMELLERLRAWVDSEG